MKGKSDELEIDLTRRREHVWQRWKKRSKVVWGEYVEAWYDG